MSEWKKKCVCLQRTWVNKRTVRCSRYLTWSRHLSHPWGVYAPNSNGTSAAFDDSDIFKSQMSHLRETNAHFKLCIPSWGSADTLSHHHPLFVKFESINIYNVRSDVELQWVYEVAYVRWRFTGAIAYARKANGRNDANSITRRAVRVCWLNFPSACIWTGYQGV